MRLRFTTISSSWSHQAFNSQGFPGPHRNHYLAAECIHGKWKQLKMAPKSPHHALPHHRQSSASSIKRRLMNYRAPNAPTPPLTWRSPSSTHKQAS